MFLRLFKHLLPNAKAWRLTTDKQLRQFFDGLSGVGRDLRLFIDLIWLDIRPADTRQLSEWEVEFGLPNTLTDEQERRDRLDAAWKARGGQSPRYVQDTLRAAGFDVYVHEWWQLPVVGSPVVRNPLTYLNDGAQPVQYKAVAGATKAICANPVAIASDLITSYAAKQYFIPNDSTKWPFFFYIGAQTFPSHATVPSTRKNEFETLCLKIGPTHQWIGVLVDYN